MVETRLDVTNGYISQDMTDANTNFENVWPYLAEIETARNGEASLDDRINSSEASAAASALDAAASALESEGYADALTTSSTTSVEIGYNSKTFIVESNLKFAAGQFVSIISGADTDNYMHGPVESYSGTTLIVNVTNIGGSGTYADWNISLSGAQGTPGQGASKILLYTVNAAAASAVVFDSEIDGTYDKYIIECPTAYGGASVSIVVGTGSPPVYQTTNYSFTNKAQSSQSTSLTITNDSAPSASLYVGNFSGYRDAISIELYRPSLTAHRKTIKTTLLYTATTTDRIYEMTGHWNATTAITAIKLYSAANITGTFKIYGCL